MMRSYNNNRQTLSFNYQIITNMNKCIVLTFAFIVTFGNSNGSKYTLFMERNVEYLKL